MVKMKPVVKSRRQHWLPSPFIVPSPAGYGVEELVNSLLNAILIIILSIVELLANILIHGALMVLSIVLGGAAALFLLLFLPNMIFGTDIGSMSPLVWVSVALVCILAGAALYFWRPWARYLPFLYIWACPKCGAQVDARATKCPQCKARFDAWEIAPS